MALLLRLQVFGNLNNGGNAGLWCLNGNNWLDRTRWNNASRLSGYQTNQLAVSGGNWFADRHRLAQLSEIAKTAGLVETSNALGINQRGP